MRRAFRFDTALFAQSAIYIFMFSLSTVPAVAAEVPKELVSACPTPHNDCNSACGTSCDYWACIGPGALNPPTLAAPISYVIDRLPYRFWRTNMNCTERIEEITFAQLPLTSGQGQYVQDGGVNRMPLNFNATSWACLKQTKQMNYCDWSAGTWGSCQGACGTTGMQTRSVSCNGAACDPSLKPTELQSCPMPACPINGNCGSANGATLASAPAGGSLCTSGSASGVSGAGPWSWNCWGSNGGGSSSCSASVLVTNHVYYVWGGSNFYPDHGGSQNGSLSKGTANISTKQIYGCQQQSTYSGRSLGTLVINWPDGTKSPVDYSYGSKPDITWLLNQGCMKVPGDWGMSPDCARPGTIDTYRSSLGSVFTVSHVSNNGYYVGVICPREIPSIGSVKFVGGTGEY